MNKDLKTINDESGKPIAGMRVASMQSSAVSVTVSGGSVGGSVYGGGKGVDMDDIVVLDGYSYHSTAFIFSIDDKGILLIPWYAGSEGCKPLEVSAGYTDMASVCGLNGGPVKTTIDIGGENIRIGGSVYGGGMQGRVGPIPANVVPTSFDDRVDITLGKGALVWGNVYGGGLGKVEVLSTNLKERQIVLNGAKIEGSIYGGSRNGDDNCKPSSSGGAPDTDGFVRGNALIRIISGEIDTRISGNVYGGGYCGYSNMDSNIRIGVPAWEELKPATDILTVRSVFGGASVGSSFNFSDTKLLLGSADIQLGNLKDGNNAYKTFTVRGNVFGEGDYCGIGGDSRVTFTGFDQGDTELSSIQKATVLELIGSTVRVAGSTDASSPDLTAMVSLNRIGDLCMHQDGGRVSFLQIDNTAPRIGGFHSDTRKPTGPDDPLNTIQLKSGSVFAVLGLDNSGRGTELQGYSLILTGGDSYYGCIAVGGDDGNRDEGFFVRTATGYEELQPHPFKMNDEGVIMWTITGVYTTTNVVELRVGGDRSAETISVNAPKMVTGSSVHFIGGYVIPEAPGSLKLVERFSGSDRGKEFIFKLGDDSSPGHLYLGDPTSPGIIVTNLDKTSQTMHGTGGAISLTVSTRDAPTSGFVGSVILHFVETVGDIPVSVFDAEVMVFLFPEVSEKMGLLHIDVTSRAGSTGYGGSISGYLPIFPSNRFATYTLTLESLPTGVDGVTVDLVDSNLNSSGWQEHGIDETQLQVGEPVLLGVGGVVNPAVRFTVTGDANMFEGYVKMRLVMESEDKDQGRKVYLVDLHILEASPVTVTFSDKCLTSGTPPIWSDYTEIMRVTIDFRTKLSDVYVAVNKGFPASLGTYATTEGYMELVKGSISVDSRVLYKTGDGFLHGNEKYVREIAGSIEYDVMPIEDFFRLYIKNKPDSEMDGTGRVVYGETCLLYDTKDCLSRFNFTREVAEDAHVYAGYVRFLKIIPFTDGTASGDWGRPDKPFGVEPGWMVMDPGVRVDLRTLLNAVTPSPGYEVTTETQKWYTLSEDRKSLIPYTEGSITMRSDVEIYLKLERQMYPVTVVIQDENGNKATLNDFKMTVNGEELTGSKVAGYRDIIVVTFDYDIGLRFFEYSIVDPDGVARSFQPEYVQSNTTRMFTFFMPDHKSELRITASSSNRVTVVLPDESGGSYSDNSLFGLTMKEGVVYADRTGSSSLAFFTSGNSFDISIFMLSSGMFNVDGVCGKIIMHVSHGGNTYVIDTNDNKGGKVTVPLSGYDNVVEVYLQVRWPVQLGGTDYNVSVSRIDPVTGEYSTPEVFRPTVTMWVCRGDMLEAVGNEGYNLIGLTCKQKDGAEAFNLMPLAEPGSTSRQFLSLGGTTDYLKDPMLGVHLQFIVEFYAGGVQVDYEFGWYLHGYMLANNGGTGYREFHWEPVEGDQGQLLLMSRLNDGESYVQANKVWTFVPSYIGFSQTPITVDTKGLKDGDEVKLRVDAVSYNINVMQPDGSGFVKVRDNWYINDGSTVGAFVDNSIREWFLGTSPDASNVVAVSIGTALRVGVVNLYSMVERAEIRDLYLHTNVDVLQIVVCTVEGGINGTHSVASIGTGGWTESVAMPDGTIVMEYSEDVGGASLTVSGCPEGTGSLAFLTGPHAGKRVLVVIYSFPVFEDLGVLM